MELYIDRDALSRGLARIQGIIERRSTHPILSHVLLHCRDGLLRMTATDTEVGFIGDLEANVTTPGEIAVDAAGLFQVVRSLPDATVHLKLVGGNRLAITSGRVFFKLLGVPADDYPALPPFEPLGTASLAERDLRRVVDQVAFAVAHEDVRWGLNGAHVEVRDADGEPRIRMVATDGHRLACSESSFDGDFAYSQRMLVPRKALAVMKKLLEGRDETISLQIGEGAMQLKLPAQTFWFRLLEGEFPEYSKVVPTEHSYQARLRRNDLASTLKRIAILVQDRSRAVRFDFSASELDVQVHNVDKGEGRETVPIELAGEPVSVGFNSKYLQDVLNAMSGDHVLLEFAHPLAPCLVKDPDADQSFFVVMPMRLD